MKFIESSVAVIDYDNPYKQIEAIGRTCYKSEDRITSDSCYKFVQQMIDNQHFAMLEHGRVTFKLNNLDGLYPLRSIPYIYTSVEYPSTLFVTCNLSHLYNPRWRKYSGYTWLKCFRSLVEQIAANGELEVAPQLFCCNGSTVLIEFVHPSDIASIANPEYHQRMSIKFTTDRGVSHELVRHRMSVAQESTRYCNYSKDKFGNSITYVKPLDFDDWASSAQQLFTASCKLAEDCYMNLLEMKLTPQAARAVLPNALKTDCILTMQYNEWQHFFDVRYHGVTGAPHPDMKHVAGLAYDEFSRRYTV